MFGIILYFSYFACDAATSEFLAESNLLYKLADPAPHSQKLFWSRLQKKIKQKSLKHSYQSQEV